MEGGESSHFPICPELSVLPPSRKTILPEPTYLRKENAQLLPLKTSITVFKKDSLRKPLIRKWLPIPVLLPRKSQWQRSLAGWSRVTSWTQLSMHTNAKETKRQRGDKSKDTREHFILWQEATINSQHSPICQINIKSHTRQSVLVPFPQIYHAPFQQQKKNYKAYLKLEKHCLKRQNFLKYQNQTQYGRDFGKDLLRVLYGLHILGGAIDSVI